jgi:hypothetical protein
MDSVAARAALQEAGCCWCDVLWEDLQMQVAHQGLVREGVLWTVRWGIIINIS